MKKTILFYGDSNTYGYDPRDYFGGRYPAEIRWTDRLAEAVSERWSILQDGMNGREVPSGDFAMAHAAASISEADPAADILGIMLGTNDLFSAYPSEPAEYAAERMDRFLEYLQRKLPDLPILLMAPPAVFTETAKDPEMRFFFRESRSLGELYHGIAGRRGLRFVNTFEWDIDLAYDGVHFSAEGHKKFAEKMAEILLDIEQV